MFCCLTETKAEQIARLRKECDWYYVTKSLGLFGDFKGTFSILDPKTDRVLARSHREAAQRFAKRHHSEPPTAFLSTKQFAKYMVIKENKPNHKRHYKYFK